MSLGGRNITNKYTEVAMEEGKTPRAQTPGSQGPKPSEKGQSKTGAHVSSSTYQRALGFEGDIPRYPIEGGVWGERRKQEEGSCRVA